jgi:non-specific serine/threonine protein kinase/serine/threonine-protein kinase
MELERWRQIEQLFHAALQREEAQRGAFLEDACAGDQALRREVESLLAHEDRSEEFMDSPALEFAAKALARDQAGSETPAIAGVAAAGARDPLDNPLIGIRVGSYRLVELIGSGGMGSVYRAVRDDDQFQKQIAVKFVHFTSQPAELSRRFRDERQILARLEHPNIARLLDAGTTDDGLPYFMMEYIEGQPIHRYCDDQRLSTRQRLELFRTVCSAVQYAHQNLVIHRDIKPGNILVTADGVPKLLDFGIAKLSDPTPPELPVESTGPRAMTPECASPEQVRGEPVTTSTDVYSLGVLLYGLLTGHKPYAFKNRLPHEIAKAICETEPQKPSLAVTNMDEAALSTPKSVSEARHTAPRELQRRLAGDLDNIVLTAIKKDAQHRYGSVEQFSEDIRRYLEGFPVMARRDTLAYRTGKFIRRHRTSVAAAVLVVITLIAGIMATAWQTRNAKAQHAKAEQRFNDLRKLALSDKENEIQNLPGTTHAQEVFAKTALQYLGNLAQESKDDPSLQRELAAAYQKVGDIEGRRGVQNLGNTSAALECYRKALKIREALAVAFPADMDSGNQLAENHRRIAGVLELRNDLDGALENDYRALKLYETSSNARPADSHSLDNLANTYSDVGRHLSMKGDAAGALNYHLAATAISEKLHRAAPADQQLRRSLGSRYVQLALTLQHSGDRLKALDYLSRAQAIDEALVATQPSNVRARLDLSSDYNHIGDLLSEMHQFEKSLESWRKALAIDQAVAEADPKDNRAKIGLSIALNAMGLLLVKTGRATAVDYLRKGLEIRQQLLAAEQSNPRRRDRVANSYANLGDAEVMLASRPRSPSASRIIHWRQARSWYMKASEIYVDLRAKGMVRADDAGEPDRIAREIAKCDVALNKAKLPPAAANWN